MAYKPLDVSISLSRKEGGAVGKRGHSVFRVRSPVLIEDAQLVVLKLKSCRWVERMDGM